LPVLAEQLKEETRRNGRLFVSPGSNEARLPPFVAAEGEKGLTCLAQAGSIAGVSTFGMILDRDKTG
jgi:hypothetical protein